MSNRSIYKDVSKGWYDAGDKGKYVNAGAKALTDLLWAYELMPDKFTDNQFNIPESGNGIPDILDEARWEFEWMLKMQDSASGGFYARVTYQDDDNLTDRMIMDADIDGSRTDIKTTDDTACAAAILAQAYLVYQDIDSTFAQTCLSAAQNAWSFLEANPQFIGTPRTGRWPYEAADDKADRLWAAGSLYRATGEAKYNDYFVANYTDMEPNFDSTTDASTWGNNFNTAFFSYLKAADVNAQVVSWFTAQYENWFNDKVARYNESAWDNIVRNGNYYWGITMQICDVPMEMIIGTKLLGTYDSNKSMIDNITYSQLGWLLGENPLGKSFVSGYGENCVEYPFSTIYRVDGLSGVPKGYMVGGPNCVSNSVTDGKQISRFAAKNYTDNFQEWTTNEHTIYWNSGLVFLTSYVNTASGPVAVTNIAVTGADDVSTIGVGDTLQMQAAVEPSNATDKTVTWSVCGINDEATSLATISSSGVLTAAAAGQVKAVATANDGSGVSGSAVITITPESEPINVTGITVTGANDVSTISVDDTLQMQAAVEPSNATDKTVTWSVCGINDEATSLATISSSGVLTAAAVGQVKVVATANDGSGVSGSAVITITPESGDVPGKPVLSHDNDDGNGDYSVTMNMYWGVNGTTYRLYENDVMVYEENLTASTPNSQSAVCNFTHKPNGVYSYYCELINSSGTTRSDVITVNVTAAAPGKPVLSNDNYDDDGNYNVTMNLWSGNNGTTFKLYENDVLISTVDLVDDTPNAQSVTVAIEGKSPGSYKYYCELINYAGSTASDEMVVDVTQ